jgi:hypothetical protein
VIKVLPSLESKWDNNVEHLMVGGYRHRAIERDWGLASGSSRDDFDYNSIWQDFQIFIKC